MVEPRRGVPAKVVELMKAWNATELFANIEYEIDELERDKNLIREAEALEIRITYEHDQCVVEPGAIVSGVPDPLYTTYTDKTGRETDVRLYSLVKKVGSQSP